MRIVLNSRQMRAVDEYMIQTMKIPSILLMENAAMGVCNIIMEQQEPCVAHVFCGTGNNGGDGLATARILMAHGYDVYVAIAGNTDDMQEDAARNYEMFKMMGDRALCVRSLEELAEWDIPQPQVVVDAIFGTGLTREVEGVQKDLIAHINELDDVLVASVDIPSGISADSGAVMGDAVRASVTATFQYPKIGHFVFPGREYTGVLEVVRIGVDEGCEVVSQANVFAYESADEDICLGKRAMDSNKGDYGRLLLVAGSRGMAGAAVLGARAASRAGAGLVTVGSVEEVTHIVQQSVPEATCKILPEEEGMLTRHSVFDIARELKGKTALAVGPGLGVGPDTQEIMLNLITDYDIPKIIDADGINALAGKMDVLYQKKGDVILTPHPKEFARLIGADISVVLKDPVEVTSRFAEEFGVTLLLKGATTVVAKPDGSASLICAGTPGMAKGGSGDVLTGVVAGLAAQGKDPYESALVGAYIAATAGEMAAEEMGEYSMTPMDTVNYIGYAMQGVMCDCIEADVAVKVCAAEAREERNIQQGVLPRPGIEEIDTPAPDTEEMVAEETPQSDPYVDKTAEMLERYAISIGELDEHQDAQDGMPAEKTAEDVLAEIEEKEQTQEIKKVMQAELKNSGRPGPTRRRIG